MPNPLTEYKKAAKQYDVTDDKNVPPVARLTFATDQLEQMQHITNRLLFDIATTEAHKAQATDPDAKDAYRAKSDEYRKSLRQTANTVTIVLKFIEELRAEHPELQVKE